jgi:hypothetical protein
VSDKQPRTGTRWGGEIEQPTAGQLECIPGVCSQVALWERDTSAAVPALPEGYRARTGWLEWAKVLKDLPAVMVKGLLRYGATPKDVVMIALVSVAMWEVGADAKQLPKLAWWMGFDGESGRKHPTPNDLGQHPQAQTGSIGWRESVHECRKRALKTRCQCEGCEGWRKEMWQGHEQSNARCTCQGCITKRIIDIDTKLADSMRPGQLVLSPQGDTMIRLDQAKKLMLVERAVQRDKARSSKKT